MRKFVRGAACFAAMLFTLGACADSPTGLAPQARPADLTNTEALSDQQVQGCVGDGVCILPPVSGGPKAPVCDPWTSLNWCEGEGGGCITSVGSSEYQGIAGCVPPGGGGAPTLPAPPPPAPTQPAPEPEPGDTCNTGDPVLESSAVQATLKDLWSKSRASEAQAQRLEHAAWIIQNPDGTYGTAPFSYSAQTPCGVNGNMNAPPGAVGWVHTHPFTAGEEMRICGPIQREVSPGVWTPVRGPDGQFLYERYANQPSQPDRSFMQALNGVRSALGQPKITGYMIDNEGTVVYGTATTKDQTRPRCGF